MESQRVAWDKLSLEEQLLLLDSDEALPVLAAHSRKDATFLADILKWNKAMCEAMCDKLKLMHRSVKNMRADIVRLVKHFVTPPSSPAASPSPPRRASSRVVPASPHPSKAKKASKKAASAAAVVIPSSSSESESASDSSSADSSPERPAASKKSSKQSKSKALAASKRLPAVSASAVPRRSRSSSKDKSPARARKSKHKAPKVNLAALAEGDSESGSDGLSGLSSGSSSSSNSDWDSASESDFEPAAASSSRRHASSRRDRMQHELARHGVQRRDFAKSFLRSAREAAAGRKLLVLYKDIMAAWPASASEHSKKECLALARILDAMLSKDTKLALELLCRRLGGVQTACETGSWEVCDRLETATSTKSFIHSSFLGSALKEVNRENAIKKSVTDSYSLSKSSSSRGNYSARTDSGKGGRFTTKAAAAAASGYTPRSAPPGEEGTPNGVSASQKKKAAGSRRK